MCSTFLISPQLLEFLRFCMYYLRRLVSAQETLIVPKKSERPLKPLSCTIAPPCHRQALIG